MHGLSYTFEEYNGLGPPDADFTRVYANLVRGGKSDRKLVLDGEYLLVSKVLWLRPNIVLLCVPEGITSSFSNEVTLSTDGSDETVYTVLRSQADLAAAGDGHARTAPCSDGSKTVVSPP
ncbi:MAG: hypothetical protein GIW96_06950 [Candidatus Eremiobacteraeota bacterium]|nr:hypothetical protein [Candidatus Eremiobacteraeota bacterium]